MNEEEKKTGSESAPKKKRKKLKRLLYFCLKLVLLFILSTIVQEIIVTRIGLSIWPFLSKYGAAIISLVCVVLEGVINLTSEEGRKAFSKMITRPAGMRFWDHVRYLLERTYVYVKRNTLIGLALIFMFFIFLPAYAASEGVGRKLFDVAQQVMNDAIPPESSQNEGEDANVTDNPIMPDPEPDLAHLPQEKTVSPEGTDVAEGDAPPERTRKTLVEQAEFLVLSENMEYTVSEEELDEIFFRGGDYVIEDWNDKQEVKSTAWKFVQGQQILRRNPSFKKDTPQPILDKVDYASRVEAELLYEEAPTAQKLCYVIDLRVEIYDSAPAYVLTTLTREDFCGYGEAYRVQGKSEELAAILYEQSILWGFKALQYETKGKDFKNDLDKLSERYSKLAMVLDVESDEYMYAQALAEVFEVLANEL